MIHLIEIRFETKGWLWFKETVVRRREISVDPMMVSMIAGAGDPHGVNVCQLLIAASKVVTVEGTIPELEAKLRDGRV